MQITLLTVGKCKEACFRTGAEIYAGRLKHYAALKQVAVREERAGSKIPVPEILSKEGERLLKALPAGAFVVVLDPAGQPCASEALSKRLSKLGLQGKNRIAFIIGGAFGLAPEVLHRAHWRMSLSPMTFPHELARLILLEQLYRAFTILRGEQYHK